MTQVKCIQLSNACDMITNSLGKMKMTNSIDKVIFGI